MTQNKSESDFDAVIFDCDGVLVDSEAMYHEVEIEVLAALGLAYDAHDFKARFMGMSDKAFYAALDEDALARIGRPVAAEFHPRVKARAAEEVHRLVAVAGAGEAVDAVRGLKAVASSSTTAALEFKLKRAGLWERFVPHIYSSEHVAHAKPAPDLFLHAAKALDVAPSRCLVIEDSVNGVRAGLAAGMQVWGFMGGGHMDDRSRERLLAANVARVVENWSDAKALLSAARS